MPEYTEIPDEWVEVKYDVGEEVNGDHEIDALWGHRDVEIGVRLQHTENRDGSLSYVVVVEQEIGRGDITTTVQSFAREVDSRKNGERLASEFMHEVCDGHHVLRTVGIEEVPNRDVLQFYCVSDDEMPGSMTAETVVQSIDTTHTDDDIEDMPDDADPEVDPDNTIQIDVFARHKDEIITDE